MLGKLSRRMEYQGISLGVRIPFSFATGFKSLICHSLAL